MEQQKHPSNDPHPNIILRGGQYDGERLYEGNPRAPLAYGKDGTAHAVYRPTGEMDSEYPTLAVFVPDLP